MKVKDIIVGALRLLGRDDLAETLAANGTAEGEGGDVVQTLLYCFNAVEDELARYYFPLVANEELRAEAGKIGYTAFSYAPVKIIGVTAEGKPVKFSVQPLYLCVDADSVSVEYWYTPQSRTMEGDSAFDGAEVGERLVAAGCAAEYCLIHGESLAAKLWEGKYREAIDKARLTHRRARALPPRRWV